MSDLDKRLDEILENMEHIDGDGNVWIASPETKQAIKQLMADEFEKLIGEEEKLEPFSVSEFNNWVAPREMLRDELRQKLEEWKK